MNEFYNQLQMLDVNDFYASEVTPWDYNQYQTMDDSRQFIFGGCVGGFFCVGIGCFGCFGCGGFGRCGGCGRCGR